MAPNLPKNLLHFVCDAVCEWLDSLLPTGITISSLSEPCEVFVNHERLIIEAIHIYKQSESVWRQGEWKTLPEALQTANETQLIGLCEEGRLCSWIE